jgi:hypothetical protein
MHGAGRHAVRVKTNYSRGHSTSQNVFADFLLASAFPLPFHPEITFSAVSTPRTGNDGSVNSPICFNTEA